MMKSILTAFLLIPIFLFAQNEKSWSDKAYDYYNEQNYEEAIVWYTKWLEAAPNDSDMWYGLACCYALNKQEKEATTSLETAIEKGFQYCKHVASDTDLSSLHENEDFQNAIEKCNTIQEENKVENFEINHTKMTSFGTYGVLLPEGYDANKSYPFCIWIHGNGSTEETHAKIAEKMELQDVIIIFPRAPYINKAVTEYNSKLGWTSNQTDGISKKDDLYMEQGAQYIEWIDACLSSAQSKYNLADRGVVLGHSQGAAYSLAYAIEHPKYIVAAMSYAGGKTSKFELSKENLERLSSNGTKITLLHGERDHLIPVEKTYELYDLLVENKVDASLEIINASHSLGEEQTAKDYIKDWITEQTKK